MASAGAIKAGKAYIELFADDSRLAKDLKGASGKLKAWGAGLRSMGLKMLAVGGVAAGMGLAAVKSFAAAGDALHKMSIRTGVSVESLSLMGYAANLAGTNIDSLGQALFRANRRIANAATEAGPARRAMKALGLDAAAVSALSPEDALYRISDALGAMNDKALASQYGFEIFGDNWRQLVPLLGQGSEALRKAMAEGKSLGVQMSTESAEAAAAMTDVWFRFTASLKTIVLVIGEAVTPAIMALTNTLTGLSATVSRFVANWSGLITGFFEWGVGGTLALGAIFFVGSKLIALALFFRSCLGWTSAIFGVFTSLTRGCVFRLVGLSKVLTEVSFKAILFASNCGVTHVNIRTLAKIAGYCETAFGKLAVALKAAFLTSAGLMHMAAFVTIAGAAVVALGPLIQSLWQLYKVKRSLREAGAIRTEFEQRSMKYTAEMTELASLSQKHKLNNMEMRKAVKLIDSLEAAYGKLGLRVSIATSRIVGFSDASRAFSRRKLLERKQALDDELAVLRQEQIARKKSLGESWTQKLVAWSPKKLLAETVVTIAAYAGDTELDLLEAVDEAQKAINKAEIEQRNITKTLSRDAVMRREGVTPGKRDELSAGTQTKRIAFLYDEQRHEYNLRESSHKKELSLLRNRHNKMIEMAKLANRIGKGDVKDIADMRIRRDWEVAEAVAKYRRSEADEKKKAIVAAKAAQISSDHEIHRIRLSLGDDNLAKKQRLIRNRASEAIALAQLKGESTVDIQKNQAAELRAARLSDDLRKKKEAAELQHEIAKLTIEKSGDSDRKKRLDLLKLDETRALAAAAGSGLDPALIRKKFDLMRQAAPGRIKSQFSVAGTFSALAASRIGPSDPARETAQNTKVMARVMERIDRRIRRGQPPKVFGW